MLANTHRLDRYKLNSEFSADSVTHRTIQSDLVTGSRRTEVLTTWVDERKLGAGAFGQVFLQRETVSGQLRAVKVIAQHLVKMNEMDVLIDLQDRRDLFVAFLGWFEDRHSVHIAMEYIEHGDLGRYITDHTAEARSQVQLISMQVLEGLVVLHGREISHRDLKPENILMASLSPLWVKITDFGIAKSWAGTALRSNSGTNVYKAPERLGLLSAQTTTYTSSVDMWAFGAIIYQILTSEIPFADRGGGLSGYFSGEQESCLDDKLLKQYCDGLVPFPIASLALQGAGANAIDFVTSLMLPDPSKRSSAADALKSVWFDEIVSSATSNQDAAVPSGSQIPFSAAQPIVGGLRATKLGAIMGQVDACKTLFANLFPQERLGEPYSYTTFATPIMQVGINHARLIVGPTGEETGLDSAGPANYLNSVNLLLNSFGHGHKINGIIHFHRDTDNQDLPLAAAMIRSLAPLCVTHFRSDVIVFAQTIVVNTGWFRRIQEVKIRWLGSEDRKLSSEQTQSEAIVHCQAIITQIANCDRMAKRSYPQPAGDLQGFLIISKTRSRPR
ncbi:hypothetical protein Q9L58_005897 [Maublancomyces gigas]|uniref:non-specific serine/threonine protein kinase n=1 Tax=Discina gigas TaxID=1032678 RepID=A0ABR3GHC1_9PEZI